MTLVGFVTTEGTSYSTPQVSGVSALLYSEQPGITPWDVLTILVNSTDDVNLPGYDFETGWGKLNASAALSLLVASRPVAVARARGLFEFLWNTGSISVRIGEDIFLDGSTLSSVPLGGPATCSWSPQGTAGVDYFIDDTSSCFTTMHTYTSAALSFNITLTVADSTGWQSVPDTLTVNTVIPPVAVARAKEAGSAIWSETGISVDGGKDVDLDGALSFDPKGLGAVNCIWDLISQVGDTIENPNSCSTAVLHTEKIRREDVDFIDVELVVTDINGVESFSDWLSIEVYAVGTCAIASSAGAGNEGVLETLRRFRDEVLNRGKGRRYVEQYYRHTAEVAGIFLSNPPLATRHWGFIQRYLPTIEAFLDGRLPPGQKNRIFTPGDAKTLKVFIDDIIAFAGPILRENLEQFKEDMDNFVGWRFEDIFIDLRTP